jgi:MFS family permease
MTDKPQDLYSKFLLIWIGQFISIIGTGLTIFSLGVYVYQQTTTASSYVFILICALLPPMLLKPYGGILADRHDRRLMMVFGDLGATLGLLFIFIYDAEWCGNIENLAYLSWDCDQFHFFSFSGTCLQSLGH